MFLSIHYPRLRNNEFIQFIKLLNEILNSNDPEVLKVNAQCDDRTALLAVFTDLEARFGSDITEEIHEIDARRDRAIVGSRCK